MRQPSQFFRINGYGRRPRRGDPDWATIEQIAAEAARVPTASRHVADRRPPLLLHGKVPVEAGRLALATAERARDGAGRKLRADGRVLYAAVASYPSTWSDLKTEAKLADYRGWRTLVIEHLVTWLGERVVSIVEHDDEAHPHLHALIVPQLTSGGQLDLSWHPGHAARQQARRAGFSHKEQERAYRRGLQRCQDDYYAAVSAPCGHSRTGARRTRLRRREALAEKATEALLVQAHQKAKMLLVAVNASAAAVGVDEVADEAIGALDESFAKALAALRHAPAPAAAGALVPAPRSDIAPPAATHEQWSALSEPEEPPEFSNGADFLERSPEDVAADLDINDDPDPERTPSDGAADDDPNPDDMVVDDPNSDPELDADD